VARKKRAHSITLERQADGTWRQPGVLEGAYVTDPDLAKTSPYPRRSPAETLQLQKILGLRNPPEGVDVKPSLLSRYQVYEHPPVPGSIGRWQGDGTKRHPYHWVGISEKLAAYAVLGLVIVWGAEQIDVDVSNWWTSSAVNVENVLTSLPQDILNVLHIPYTVDNNGHVTSTGARQTATFWTWLAQQVMVQAGDLEAAVTTINGLSGPPPNG